MIEEGILQNGILTKEDIEEIHRVFVMMDQDGTGDISVVELRNLAATISKNPNISMDEAYTVHGLIDKNKDGKVSWEEFLEFVSKWLTERGYVKSKVHASLPSSALERTALHKGLANLFSLQHVIYDVDHNPDDSLENRLETWDYLGEGMGFTEEERENYYNSVAQILLTENGFQSIQDEVCHSDLGIVLSGLKKLRDLLYVMALYQNSGDRVKISGYLIRLFDLLLGSNIIGRVLQCLGADSASEIQWEALKIITLFAPGPRIPGLNLDHPMHVSQNLPKNLLMGSGAMSKVVELCESGCIEVRDQALLALGFTVRHDPDIRDYMNALNVMDSMKRIMNKGAEGMMEIGSLLRCVWDVSILCGATMPRDRVKPPYSQEQLTEVADCLVRLFNLSEQENLLANCMTGLSYILPALDLNDFTKQVLIRVVALLSHSSAIVKRSALQAIRQIILFSPAQCQLITEIGLYSKLSETLSIAHDSFIKLDTCSVIRFLITHGYAWEILNLSTTVHSMMQLIDTDKDVRWEAVRLVKTILETQSRIVADKMASVGVMQAVFNHIGDFREVSPTISEIYNVTCVTYNFSYLYDCALVLSRFIAFGWPNDDQSRPNEFRKYLGQSEAVKIFDVVKCLIEEVRKGNHDLYQLDHGEVRLEKGLSDLIDLFTRVHAPFTGDSSSQFLVQYLGNVMTFFTQHLQQANFSYLSQHGVNLDTLVNCVDTFNLKCIDDNNYPNGDNRLITRFDKNCLKYFEIKQAVANLYGVDKNLFFIDPKGDKITINNQELVQFAIFTMIQTSLEDYVNHLNQVGQQVPNPLIIPSVDLRFVVSGSTTAGFTSAPTSGFMQSIQNVYSNTKEGLFKELASAQNISFDELEKIHQEFLKATSYRGDASGRVDFNEFRQLLSSRVTNQKTLQELFHAVDVEKNGAIDFRNFIVSMCVLRSGSFEQRLWFAFRAYDSDGSNTIDKNEMYNLLRSALEAKGGFINDGAIWDQINITFRVYDTNNSGSLSFEQFKQAVINNYVTLNPFWTHTNFENFNFQGFIDAETCSQCMKRFYPNAPVNRNIPIRCVQCTLATPPSPSKAFQPISFKI